MLQTTLCIAAGYKVILYSVALLAIGLSGSPAFSQQSPPEAAARQTADNSASDQINLNIPAGKQSAFYLAEKSGTAHGGVLIVPDHGEKPNTYGDLNLLRHTLADNHWHTLALDTSNLQPPDIQQLIAAGVVYLNGKGVFNIAVLGKGQGTAHALRYVANLPSVAAGSIQQIRALVMINANNVVPTLDGNAMAPLTQLRLPVLDAYQGSNFRQQQQAAERKQLVNRQNTQYQQARLPYSTTQTPQQESRITKRIRGWLDKHVAGFMVDRRL